MRSSKQSHFARIPQVGVRRSVFNRSFTHKTTFNEGYLVPVFVDEVLPGDTFTLDFDFFCRLSTPIVPFMDNLYFDYFFFYVPNRLVWSNFQRFMGEQDDTDDNTDFLIPQATCTNAQVGSLWDYFGLPLGVNKQLSVNALPFRMYCRIFNEWFRDENLVDPKSWGKSKGDGPDNWCDVNGENFKGYPLCKRGKRHDYFTSCLPWPQKGPGVDIPLGSAPVYFEQGETSSVPVQQARLFHVGPAGSARYSADGTHGLNVSATTGAIGDTAEVVSTGIGTNYGFAAHADLDPVTINALRQAFQLQKFYELNARGGTRYTEILRAHFGVVSPDARLQRPEYLGGGSRRISVKPVEQNSSTDTTSPQGNLAAYAVAVDGKRVFTKSFVEHGFIIGLVNVRADLTYQQGINRMWSRETREDLYWPVFAHLGEQAVLNKEIFAQGTEDDDKVFGYQERYAEYRYKPSMITGKFRSGLDGGSLDMWHLSQYFENLPTLSEQFITDQPPVSRVVAVQDEPHFLLDCLFTLKCVRPMPVYSVPGLVDHF